MQIRNDDVTLNLAEDGDPAAPPLLLLHGITSFGGTWEWTIEGAGHLIHDEIASRPKFRAAVMEFLDRVAT